MIQRDIYFLRCNGSEPRKSAGLPECPRIVLPRKSPLGKYLLKEFQPEMPPGEKDFDPRWPFSFACMNCGQAFDYPTTDIQTLHVPRSRKECETQKEHETEVRGLTSKRFWELEIAEIRDGPLKYAPLRIYTVAGKDIKKDDVVRAVRRVVPAFEDFVASCTPPVKAEKIDVAFFDYDFLK